MNIDDRGMVAGYTLRQRDPKRQSVLALKTLYLLAMEKKATRAGQRQRGYHTENPIFRQNTPMRSLFSVLAQLVFSVAANLAGCRRPRSLPEEMCRCDCRGFAMAGIWGEETLGSAQPRTCLGAAASITSSSPRSRRTRKRSVSSMPA